MQFVMDSRIVPVILFDKLIGKDWLDKFCNFYNYYLFNRKANNIKLFSNMQRF